MLLILLSQLIVPNKEPWTTCTYASTSMLYSRTLPVWPPPPSPTPFYASSCGSTEDSKLPCLHPTQLCSARSRAVFGCSTAILLSKEGRKACCCADKQIHYPSPLQLWWTMSKQSQACPRKLTACLCIIFHSGSFLQSHQKVSAVHWLKQLCSISQCNLTCMTPSFPTLHSAGTVLHGPPL